MHYTTKRFWKCYDALPADIQQVADRNYELLKVDPSHPSLHFKKVGESWSVRVGKGYRALGVETTKGISGFGLAHMQNMISCFDEDVG